MLKSTPQSLEAVVRNEMNRDAFICRYVLNPDSGFTLEETDAIVFVMCPVFRNHYRMNVSYYQMVNESRFEHDWASEDFGDMPHSLRMNGWDRGTEPPPDGLHEPGRGGGKRGSTASDHGRLKRRRTPGTDGYAFRIC